MKKLLCISLLLTSTLLYSYDFVRYSCLIDRIDIEHFTAGREFDESGILTARKQYNPLVISQYGILSYYEFLATGDSLYYQKCLAQASYFKDSSKVNYLFNGKGIGLPYNFNYKEMKSPWYSGMTQGYATSFLLRYYDLTHDSSILPIIQKIVYLMIKDQSVGGTISTTLEGYKWIEEYPNSEKSPQVLNGALNGLIGLKEYCDFFNNDSQAKNMLDAVYEGVINSLTHYDTYDWSYYNRKRHRISTLYLRYQIHQMRQLHRLFNDSVFQRQMSIWGIFSYKKRMKTKAKMYKLIDYDLCVAADEISKNIYGIKLNNQIDFQLVRLSYFKSKKKVIKDAPNKKLKMNQVEFVKFEFEKTAFNLMQLCIKEPENIVDIQLFHQVNNELVKINHAQLIEKDKFYFHFDQLYTGEIIAKIIKKTKSVSSEIVCKFYNHEREEAPFLAFFKTDTMFLNEQFVYDINFESWNSPNVTVLYRSNKNESKLNQTKWSAKKFCTNELSPPISGYYEFAVIFELESPLSAVSNFTIEEHKSK